MVTDDLVLQKMEALGASVKPKRDSRMMKIISWFLGLLGNKSFMTSYWTTVHRTIYYPLSVSDPYDASYRGIMIHELKHVEQLDDMGGVNLPDWLWMICYLMFPVPIFFAWFRWRAEREAYLPELLELRSMPSEICKARVHAIVHNLWYDYAWTWPKLWMRKWFLKELGL